MLNVALHTRIFYKEAISLSKKYTTSIIGIDESTENYHKNQVKIIPIPKFSGRNIRFWLKKLKIIKLAHAEKAQVYHLHTPEILVLSLFLKIFTKSKIIYDIHENYHDNYLNYNQHSKFFRFLIAKYIRFTEKISLLWIDHVIYAEKCYENFLNVKKNNYTIVENTFVKLIEDEEKGNNESINFVQTGTLAKEWGVFSAIQLWKLANQFQATNLTIAGFTRNKNLIEKIHLEVNKTDFPERFQLIGGLKFVNYETIQKEIAKADFVLALYETLPNISAKIPTKFYEAIGFQKPVLFSENVFWNELNDDWDFGQAFNIQDSDENLKSSLKKVFQKKFYKKNIPKTEVFWEHTEKELLKIYKNLIGS